MHYPLCYRSLVASPAGASRLETVRADVSLSSGLSIHRAPLGITQVTHSNSRPPLVRDSMARENTDAVEK